MSLTIDTDNDIRSTDNARQMQPMMECRRCSRAVGAPRKSAKRQFAHCPGVTQYFDYAAVGAVFGAVNLRGTAGDTLHVPLDHPAVREGVTQDMLVCDTNTTTFANPVYSRPCAPAAGDTVLYLLDGPNESPTDLPEDTTVLSLADDKKVVAKPEGVLFIVDVISHDDETILEPLDSILYRPVNDFHELDQHSIEGFPVDSTIVAPHLYDILAGVYIYHGVKKE